MLLVFITDLLRGCQDKKRARELLHLFQMAVLGDHVIIELFGYSQKNIGVGVLRVSNDILIEP